MPSGDKKDSSSKSLNKTIYIVCKSCGKTEGKSSLSSSTASSKVSPPVAKRRKANPDAAELRYKGFPHYVKLDVVFAGRATIGGNACASIQRPMTLHLRECYNSEDDSMDLGSPTGTTPTCNNTRMILLEGKRKAYDNNVMASLVDTLNAANKAIADKLEMKESWSIEKEIDVLNSFDDLERRTFNLTLRHFQDKGNRLTFMHLSPVQQRDYIDFNMST